MADYTISISVDSNGNFTYCPSALRVELSDSDTLTWTCSNGPFAVSFKDHTPLDKLDARGTAHTPGWSTGAITFDQDARAGHYHYAVAVFDQSPGLVHMDAACPEIIVN